MLKNTIKISFLSLFFFSVSAVLINPTALCQQPPTLQEGIDQYNENNYEKAIESLERARSEDPKSTVAAFFLGLAYKQTYDYEKALGHFRDAVTMTPRIKEAVIELVDVAMQLGDIEEAKRWIGVAEEANILPAKTSFLKGLILKEEGKNELAETAFLTAKSIDPTIAQAADIQIALSHMTERELKKAKESFESAITHDPHTDLAGFARQYLATVEQRIALERPLRFYAGVFGHYDDNMVLNWTDQSLIASDITNEGSRVLNTTFRVNYTPSFNGPFLFNAQYAFSSRLHNKNVHSHDSLLNSLSITPGYNFGKYSLNLSTRYTHSLVRSPSYKKYSGFFNTGPLLRWAIKTDQLVEIFAGYLNDEYFEPALAPEEDRDSNGYNAYANWLWLFKENSFFSVGYKFFDQDADGENWDYAGHGISVNITTPIIERVKLQFSGQVFEQDFKNEHTEFNVKREDTLYTFSGGFSRDIYKDIYLVVQYTRIRNDSNAPIYDYTRNIYTLGMEYRF
jgi:tetratricopeptide (TPR) repeat protein